MRISVAVGLWADAVSAENGDEKTARIAMAATATSKTGARRSTRAVPCLLRFSEAKVGGGGGCRFVRPQQAAQLAAVVPVVEHILTVSLQDPAGRVGR